MTQTLRIGRRARWTAAVLVGVALGWLTGTAVFAQGTLSNQVLALLSRVNTWTDTNTFQDLRVTLGVPSITTNRIYADGSANLYFNGVLVAGAGGVTNPHNLLSVTHPDTAAAAAARGAVIVGNATPAWSRLALCPSGNYVGSNGTDTVCATSAAAFTAIPAANLTGTIAAISGANLTTLNASNLASGTVPLAQLANITNTQIAAGAAIVYTKLALTNTIVNADIAAAAGIVYSKLSLTTSIVNGDLANATILFAKWATNGCTNLQVAQFNGAAWVCKSLVVGDVSGAGTVSSVAMTVPAGFSIAGSPVTTSGTLALSYANATANFALIGPTTGAATAPTFRALVNNDLPLTGVVAGSYPKVTINTAGVVTGTATQITLTTDATGILPRANGGTGVGVAGDDTILVGSGAAWVAATVPDCTTGMLEYTQATNLFNCATSGGPSHNLLSATHPDTTAAAAVRGAMIVANSTPLWTAVSVGTAGQLWSVNSGGTDPGWSNTVARGSIAASTPWSLTQTWNAGGVVFRGVELAITDTASAAGSTGFRILGGAGAATVEFAVDKAGVTSITGNLVPAAAGTPTLGTAALPFGSVVLGTAATNNLTVTPAAFAAGVVATVDDPGLAAVKVPLIRRGTIAYTTGAILAGSCAAAVTATVTGLATTATVWAGLNAAPQTAWKTGITYFAYPSANTVNIAVCNPTAGPITPESATFNYSVVVP